MSQYTIHYKSNNNVVYSCKYQVVWCPKYRRAVLANGVDTRLKAIIQDVCAELRAELLQLEVMPDHVHLLVEVDPQSHLARHAPDSLYGLAALFQKTGKAAKAQRAA